MSTWEKQKDVEKIREKLKGSGLRVEGSEKEERDGVCRKHS